MVVYRVGKLCLSLSLSLSSLSLFLSLFSPACSLSVSSSLFLAKREICTLTLAPVMCVNLD